MKLLWHSLRFCLFVALLGNALAAFSVAQEPEPIVPAPLAPWVEWVKDANPSLRCSLLQAERVCVWPGVLRLSVGPEGGLFEVPVILEKEGFVSLPGGGDLWPVNVTADSASALVLDRAGAPKAFLKAGKHDLKGHFVWASMPKTLPLPVELGPVSLEVRGTKVEQPKITGRDLWLQDATDQEAAESDSVRIHVSRKLVDGTPFHIFTSLELRVAGRARELRLGSILPAGFVPVSVTSTLAYKVGDRWDFSVQLRPGVHQFTIDAVVAAPPSALSPPEVATDGWPEEEVWVFEPFHEFRVVELGGVSAIDPNRTELPEDWRSFSAYVLRPEQKLEFIQVKRGEKELAPNALSVSRRMWLDLDGEGMTVQDMIGGQMNRDWRLDIDGAYLTRATVDGVDQVITENRETKSAGIEVRSETVNVQTVSRIEGAVHTLPAIGWAHDVNSLHLELNLAPGWKLLEVLGADNNPGTWLSTWRLWDLFFLCLMSIATGKLLGKKWGVVSLFALVLSHGEYGAPMFIWVNLLIGKALLNELPGGLLKQGARVYSFVAFGVLLAILIPFSIDQVRLGLYPQLYPAFDPAQIFTFILAPVFFIAAAGASLAFVFYLIGGLFKRAFQLLVVSIALCLVGTIVIGIFSSGAFQSRNFSSIGGGIPAAAPAPQSLLAEGSFSKKQRMRAFEAQEIAEDISGSSYERNDAPDELVAREQLLQVDPKAVVQTGAAIPNWNWRTWQINWSGPVGKDRKITLYLLGPKVNLVLAFLRVLLLAALAAAFFRVLKLPHHIPAPAILLFALLFFGEQAQAQTFPDNGLLNELGKRIERHECTQDCVSVSQLQITADNQEIKLLASISSLGNGAWPVPGPLEEFAPAVVLIDGKASNEFRRTADGLIWLRIPAGNHSVELRGSVKQKNIVTLQFGLAPKHVDVLAPDWTVDGVNPQGGVEETVQLLRKAPGGNAEKRESTQEEVRLGRWHTVNREFQLGMPWTIRSVVQRLGDTERAEIFRFPLLPGEAVTSAGSKVEQGSVILTFPRGSDSVEWTSTLSETPNIALKALDVGTITEDWQVRCSAIWRCSFEGLLPMRSRSDGQSAGVWSPFPGESVQIHVEKPLAIDGPVVTVDHTEMNWRPGSGLIQGNLQFNLRASQGGLRSIVLPEGSSLESVLIDGTSRTLSLDGQRLTLSVEPGNHEYNVNFRLPWTGGVRQKLPTVDMGGSSSNVTLTVSVPEKRWLLWVCGPQWGPAILFWGELIVVVAFGWFVGAMGVPPLTRLGWILLGLGMATLHPALMLLPAINFWALSRRQGSPLSERWKFNLAQIVLSILVTSTLVLLALSIYHGLIVEPDMSVAGNGSTNTSLRWYVDHIESELPLITLISAPIWLWRVLMLAWSTWLVFAIIRWIKWSWSALNAGGLWKGKLAA